MAAKMACADGIQEYIELSLIHIWIKDKFSLRTSVSRIPVVTELAPDAMYDVIFVCLCLLYTSSK